MLTRFQYVAAGVAVAAVFNSVAARAADGRSRNDKPRAADDGGIAALHHCDVIVGDLTGPSSYNTVTGPTGGYVRYALGTTACNIGNEPLDWYDFGTPNPTWHPVIAQNLYRYKNGRFEQIGLSWLKHAQCALQMSLCETCSAFCGGCCDELGAGCSDPYSSSMNGNPSTLGPRSQVNASSGRILVWPYGRPNVLSSSANNNGQIHVRVEDIDPAQNPGAIYVAEGQYLSEDESLGLSSHRNNNASWRRVNVAGGSGFPLSYNGATVREQPAILAWRLIDPAVVITEVDVPGDGRFILGCRASDIGGGWWRYEYALFNLTSDRSGRGFTVPLGECVNVRNSGFKDIDYHSGDGETLGVNYEGIDWSPARSALGMTWTTKTIAETANANALRWGTMYNFWFEADAPPSTGTGVIDLFKAGAAPSIAFSMPAPQAIGPSDCPADVFGGDQQVNTDDLLVLLSSWGPQAGDGDCFPPCGDGVVNTDDLLAMLGAWGPCP